MTEPRQGRTDPDWTGLGLLAGRVAGLLGILLALVGAIGADISLEALGIVLGITGYALGSHKLGAAAVVISVVILVLVLAVMRGYFPGIEPVYPGVF